MSEPRNYHSVALLLTDGRVLSAGVVFVVAVAANHQDGQVYSPPYLYNPDGSLASRTGYIVCTQQVFEVERFLTYKRIRIFKNSVSSRCLLQTHAVNTDLRFLNIPFTEVSSGNYRLNASYSIHVLSPGFWMLFALNGQGVPSVASVVQVSTEGIPKITSPGDQFSAEEDTISLPIVATDSDGDPLTFSAVGLPPGLSINSVSGIIGGTLALGSSGSYDVTVSVTDGSDVAVTVFTWVVTLDGTGQISRKWWTGISGDNISALTNDPDFPDNPDGSDLLTSFEAPTDWGDSYGTLIQGYLHPVSSGNYTFWIASDDNGELWLSSDEMPSNASLIAEVPGWSSPRQWNKFPEQQSATINLQAGQKYYMEALQKEGGGLDNLAVAWQGPGLSQQVIQGQFVSPYAGTPTVTSPGDQVDVVGTSVSLAVSAFDPDSDPLTFTISGLPNGLGINASTGLITGTPTLEGVFNVTVNVSDGNGGSDSASFTWTISAALVLDPIVSPPHAEDVSVTYTAGFTGGANPRFKWLFGDGTPETSYSSSPSITHTFSNPNRYVVKVTGTDDSGVEVVVSFVQAIHGTLTSSEPSASTSVLYEERAGNDRVWNVNPDNDSVSVFDTVTDTKLKEISVGQQPRSLAVAPDGRVWVVNKDDATISVIEVGTLNVVQTLALPGASQPFGLVFHPNGNYAYVALEATGQLQRLNAATGAMEGTVDVGSDPRHLSVNGTGSKVFVSRFVSPPLPGENTASPQTEAGGNKLGGEVAVVATSTMTVSKTIVLQHSNELDSEHAARGIPNYLGAAVISPDGLSAWVASKQDNIKRGEGRDGRRLTHDTTVRSIASRINLMSETEDYPGRVDHDNGGIATSALFSRFGSYPLYNSRRQS